MTEQTLASQADAAASEALASVAAQDAQAAPAAIPTPAAPLTPKSTGTTDRSSSVSDGDPVPPTQPPAAAAPARKVVPASAVVVAFARSHLRARYRHGATGPSSFDCSGLMWRVFREAGLGGKVTSTSARAIYASYRSRGLTSRTKPQIGDLVIWGRGSHVGVYIGKGLAISALVQGVRVHRVHAMFTPFTAYLRTHLSSIEKPAWELDLAKHMKTLRHATRRSSCTESASRVERDHGDHPVRHAVRGRSASIATVPAASGSRPSPSRARPAGSGRPPRPADPPQPGGDRHATAEVGLGRRHGR